MVKEQPILFSSPMVRAILEGRKTQTRRICKVYQAPHGVRDDDGWPMRMDAYGDYHREPCLYGEPGDRLWVRETWALEDCGADGKRVIWQADRAAAWLLPGNVLGEIYYLPSDYSPGRWRPSIHMPRWAARLTLEVTEVCVQRLQEISEEDAKAEGVEASVDPGDGHYSVTARQQLEHLWDSINGERPGCSWEANPWVWCVSFQRVS